MSAPKIVGHAPTDARCDCEHSACHANGNCSSPAWVVVDAFGHSQKLCAPCYRAARLAGEGAK